MEVDHNMAYPTDFTVFNSPVNNFQTLLTSDITSTATTVYLDSTAGLPVPGLISIGNEVILYTILAVGSVGGCTRGFDGTSNSSHSAGDIVERRVVANDISVLQVATGSLEDFVGIDETVSLNNNQTSAIQLGTIFTVGTAYRMAEIDYEIARIVVGPGVSRWTKGKLSIIKYAASGVGAVLSDISVDVDSNGSNTAPGVTFSVTTAGNIATVKYTSTNVGVPSPTYPFTFHGKIRYINI
jgi:hypothetical protein